MSDRTYSIRPLIANAVTGQTFLTRPCNTRLPGIAKCGRADALPQPLQLSKCLAGGAE